MLAADRPKLSKAERLARLQAGNRRWRRRVSANVDELFAVMDADDRRGLHDPADFAARYRRTYGQKLPLYYARQNTEFGERYGRKMTAEDAGLGEFENDDSKSIDEMVEEGERWLEEHEAPRCPVCKVAPVKMRGIGSAGAKTCGAPACKLTHTRKMSRKTADKWRLNNIEHYRKQQAAHQRKRRAKKRKQKEQQRVEQKLHERRGGFAVPFGEPVVSYGLKNPYDSYVLFTMRLGISPLTEERWRLLAA